MITSFNNYLCAKREHDRSNNVTKCSKMSKINNKFHAHIINHHEKCIQISTNMPGIGLVILEIAFVNVTKKCMVKPMTLC